MLALFTDYIRHTQTHLQTHTYKHTLTNSHIHTPHPTLHYFHPPNSLTKRLRKRFSPQHFISTLLTLFNSLRLFQLFTTFHPSPTFSPSLSQLPAREQYTPNLVPLGAPVPPKLPPITTRRTPVPPSAVRSEHWPSHLEQRQSAERQSAERFSIFHQNTFPPIAPKSSIYAVFYPPLPRPPNSPFPCLIVANYRSCVDAAFTTDRDIAPKKSSPPWLIKILSLWARPSSCVLPLLHSVSYTATCLMTTTRCGRMMLAESKDRWPTIVRGPMLL